MQISCVYECAAEAQASVSRCTTLLGPIWENRLVMRLFFKHAEYCYRHGCRRRAPQPASCANGSGERERMDMPQAERDIGGRRQITPMEVEGKRSSGEESASGVRRQRTTDRHIRERPRRNDQGRKTERYDRERTTGQGRTTKGEQPRGNDREGATEGERPRGNDRE